MPYIISYIQSCRVIISTIYVRLFYEMDFTLCVLFVYNDNGSVQTLCITRVSALCTKCLHRPIVIFDQQYTKGEIHFIYLHSLYTCKCLDCVSSITVFEIAAFILKLRRDAQ